MTTESLSRRRLIRSGAAILTGVSMPALAKSAAPRALALIGDRYHNADYIRLSLNNTFEALNMPIDYTIDTESISAALLKKYDLFLILRDGMLWPGGYSGPDAYVAYETNLENNEEWPAAKSVMWMTESRARRSRTSSTKAAASIRCTIPATTRCRRRIIAT